MARARGGVPPRRGGGGPGGGGTPPAGGGAPPPVPPTVPPVVTAPEPEWDRLCIELLDAAHDVLEIPARIQNLSNPKIRFIQTLSFVEATVGGGGSPVTNADAETRKDAAVYRLGNYTPPAAPGGETTAHPTNPHNPPHDGGHTPAAPAKKPWWQENLWDPFWTGKTK